MKTHKMTGNLYQNGNRADLESPTLTRSPCLLHYLTSMLGLVFAALSLYFTLSSRSQRHEKSVTNLGKSKSKLTKHMGFVCVILALAYFGSEG